jgi:exodeoxyribonuclease VII large subunit
MRNLLEVEIGDVWVEGEISNFRRQASGHLYFTLKDEGAQLAAVMFRGATRDLRVEPDNGVEVRVFGEVSLYEAQGKAQLIVRSMEHKGLGDLQARFEELKRKLAAEGLFDAARKQPLPVFPRVIGLVTSPTGAALQDLRNVLERRAPWVQLVLAPVRVQGKGAEREIAAAIRNFGRAAELGWPVPDVLIVGRGGGSLEDLWNFNEEIVVRAIAACPVPLISAVGHEIDFTLSDFAADVRAPTPSAAAELAVPDAAELRARVATLGRRLRRPVGARLQRALLVLAALRRGALSRASERILRAPVQRLDEQRELLEEALQQALANKSRRLVEAQARLEASRPEKVLGRRGERLALASQRIGRTLQQGLERRQRRLERSSGLLRALGPAAVFARGFSLTLDASGHPVTSASQVGSGDELRTVLADGEVRSLAR